MLTALPIAVLLYRVLTSVEQIAADKQLIVGVCRVHVTVTPMIVLLYGSKVRTKLLNNYCNVDHCVSFSDTCMHRPSQETIRWSFGVTKYLKINTNTINYDVVLDTQIPY